MSPEQAADLTEHPNEEVVLASLPEGSEGEVPTEPSGNDALLPPPADLNIVPDLASQPPGWMRAKKQKQAAARERATLRSALGDIEPDGLSTTGRWGRRVLNYILTGYMLSLLLHIFIIGTASLLVYTIRPGPQSLNLMGFDAGGEGGDLEFSTVIEGEPEGKASESPSFEFSSAEAYGPDSMIAGLDSIAGAAGGPGTGEEGGGTGAGGGLTGPQIGVPAFAVTKGSFSVWTEPRDPRPGQTYKIFVHVKLGRPMKVYPLSDLSGIVEGTDGFKMPISRGLRDAGNPTRVPVENDAVQLRLFVPGAAQLIRDKITVKSKVLKEEQVLTIEF